MKLESKIYTRKPADCEVYGPVQNDGEWCMAVAKEVYGDACLIGSEWAIEKLVDSVEWYAREGDYIVENDGYFIPVGAERFHELYEEA